MSSDSARAFLVEAATNSALKAKVEDAIAGCSGTGISSAVAVVAASEGFSFSADEIDVAREEMLEEQMLGNVRGGSLQFTAGSNPPTGAPAGDSMPVMGWWTSYIG